MPRAHRADDARVELVLVSVAVLWIVAIPAVVLGAAAVAARRAVQPRPDAGARRASCTGGVRQARERWKAPRESSRTVPESRRRDARRGMARRRG
jgi:hypothetical protein